MRESKIKLGDVILDAVVDENPDRVAEVTQKPVETGQDISDYMKQKPTKVHLSGHCVKNAPNKLAKLRNYQKNKELLKYKGRNIFTDVVITELNTKHNANNAFGFDFDILLTGVRIAKPESFKITARDPQGNTSDKAAEIAQVKTQAKSQAGRQQLQKQSEKLTTKTNAYRGIRNNLQLNADDYNPYKEAEQQAFKNAYNLLPRTTLSQGDWKNSLKDKFDAHVKYYDNQKGVPENSGYNGIPRK